MALLCGHRPPELNGPFRYLDLGCGQGVDLLIKAACHPQAQFVGVDCNPQHIAHGRALAAAAGLANAEFVLADFVELEAAPPANWGPFDIVSAHGVLGWVSGHVGSTVLRLAAALLRPGGLLYLSYNTEPGWLAAVPFQELVKSLLLRSPLTPATEVLERAKALFRQLNEAEAKVFPALPGLQERLEQLQQLDPHYLVHEYAHSGWKPQCSEAVLREAADLGLDFLGSSNLTDNFSGLLPEAWRQLIQQQPDRALQEQVRDLCVMQAFRHDVYAKGKDPLWQLQVDTALADLRVLRLADAETLKTADAFQFNLVGRELKGDRDWFTALMERLPQEPRTVRELLKGDPQHRPLPELLQNLALLQHKQLVALLPAQAPSGDAARRLNRYLCEAVVEGSPYRVVALPESGGCRGLNDVEMLALAALAQDTAPKGLPAAVWASLETLKRVPTTVSPERQPQPSAADLEGPIQHFIHSTFKQLKQLGAVAA